MPLQILQHTPSWVFGLFAVLLALGSRQLLPSQAGLRRLTVMPVAMAALSAFGMTSAFGGQPAALAAWAAAAGAALWLVLQRPLPAGVHYDRTQMRFSLPGTAVPLVLMMGIFFTKYAVGVQTALHPQLMHQAGIALAVSTLYGAFAGVFLGRSLRLWKLALRSADHDPAQPLAAPFAK